MDKSLDEIIGAKSVEKSSGSAGVGKKSNPRRRSGRDQPSGRRRPSGPSSSPGGPMKAVVIRNLHQQISEDDLRDLFREVGPVTRALADTDDNGKRTGLAWVLYQYADDAAVAAGRYNGRRAAGKVISVRQVRNIGDVGLSLNDRIAGSSRASSRPTKARPAKNKARKPEKRGPKSQEELDAELDAYMQDEPTGIVEEVVASDAPNLLDAHPAPEAPPEPAPEPIDDISV